MSMRATVEGVTIALESLRSNKIRAFLTILGVAIGVATVTGITSIMAGLQKGISEDVASIGRGQLHRVPVRPDGGAVRANRRPGRASRS